MNRALLIDDEPGALDRLAAPLRAEGWTVVAVPSGRAALAAIADGPWDLVLLDLTLPDVPAAHVFQHLRRTPGLRQVPVLALSTRALPIDRAAAAEHGANDFLPKPFRPQELLERVRRLVRAHPHPSQERSAP